MSGRHRRTQAASARRALAGTVPVLGLAGVVTAAVGSVPDSAPEAVGTALVTTPIPAPDAVALDQPVLGVGPDVTTVAADAAKAAGQAGERQREQERRSIAAVVDDVRDDARARGLAVDRQGREQLDAFRREVQERRDTAQPPPTTAPTTEPTAPPTGDDRDVPSCTWGDVPMLGGTDGDEIVGRDCGLLDLFGHQRSSDPWIDGQLLQSRD